MYCSKCGKELPEGAQFCPSCGNPVSPPPVPSQTQDSGGHDQGVPLPEQPSTPAGPQPNPPTEAQSSTPPKPQANTPPAPQQNIPPVSGQDTPPVPNEEIKCPRCGATGCTPQYKQNVSGGGYGCCSGGLGALVLGPLGLLCGACGRSVKSTNTLVWICPNCGHEFRVQSKQEAKTAYMTGCLIMFFCALVLDVLLAYMGHDSGQRIKPLVIFTSVFMAAGMAFIAYMSLYKKPLVKYTDEECQQLKNFTIICIAITLLLGFVAIAFV